MSLVQQMTPLNLEEEKQKFFEKDCKYNPQFKYEELITLNKLYHYGKPKEEYLDKAEQILHQAFDNRTEEEIRALEGEKITQEKAQMLLNEFLKKNNLEDILKIKWSEDFLGKASYYKNTLKLQVPLWHREYEFKGTIYHELGTHALRRINYTQQPFFKKKAKLGFKDYMKTEEGLAGFHTLLARRFKLDYTGALNYKLSSIAQKNSFINTFKFVSKYIQDKERAWRYTIKHKRGLYDTSEEGGFTKDIVYFEGLIEIWDFLQKSNFDLEGLYFGKIAYEDIPKAKEMNPDFKPQLPHFITQERDKYQAQIQEIARVNHLID